MEQSEWERSSQIDEFSEWFAAAMTNYSNI